MTRKEITRLACDELEKIYPDIDCTLDYSKPYELMFAARLAAQCTDARVNIVTKTLFVKYPSIEAFANADWIVLPYNSATQSGVVIDGYRYGRPCIAFNVGAITEQVCEGVSGCLIEPGDNEAFAEKLREGVRMDKQSYQKLSRSSYEYGLQKYSADGAVERFISLTNE